MGLQLAVGLGVGLVTTCGWINPSFVSHWPTFSISPKFPPFSSPTTISNHLPPMFPHHPHFHSCRPKFSPFPPTFPHSPPHFSFCFFFPRTSACVLMHRLKDPSP